jgi:beta-N-acetylhexosaminidase
MVNHAAYPSLDATGRPASLSPEIAGRLLRRRLGFRGLAVSDDLDMHALDAWGDAAERAAESFAAGCDVVFLCQSLDSAVEAARRLASPGLAARREEAARRLAAYGRRLTALRKAATSCLRRWEGVSPA